MGEDLDIVGLGLAIVDVVLRLERVPTWGDPGPLGGFTLADGGPAGTACAVASTLGLRTGLIDTVGNDDMAARKLRSLETTGVDTSRMIRRQAAEDHVVAVYVNAQTGDRVFSFRRDFLSQPVRPEELDRAYLTSARFLHLDCCHPQAALAAARWMHETGGAVVLDAAATDRPVPDSTRALVAETDYLICGSGFGRMLTGEKDLWEAGRAILDLGPRVAVQTEGVDGSYTVSADERFHTPAFEVDVVDTTGAGDVFHGAYLAGLVWGWELRRIATFATGLSALHCTVLGNRRGIPSREEVEAFVEEPGITGVGIGSKEARMGRIGITSTYWGTKWMEPLEEYERRIARAASLGFELVSFGQDVPLLYSSEQQKRFLGAAQEHDIKLNYLAGLGPNQDLNSDSAEDRQRGIEHLQNLARKLADMQPGADLGGAITGVMRQGLGPGREKERCWENCVASMREAIKVAEDVGIVFHFEVLNRFEHFLINTSAEASRFIDDVGSPNLKMMLDTYHMNIEEDSLGEAIVSAGDKLGIFHIGENNRRPPGRGHIQWDEVVAALKRIDHQGDTVMEPVVQPGGDVGTLLAVWRDMSDGQDLDQAAREGLEFYKAKLAAA